MIRKLTLLLAAALLPVCVLAQGGVHVPVAGGESAPAPVMWFNGTGWVAASASNPLPISGSITVGSTTDNTAFTVGTGSISVAGGYYTSGADPSIATGNVGRVRMDAHSWLGIDCEIGCAGGSFNNNADAVATSATNGQTAAWLYGFNGTTWDRLRDDTNKYIYVDIGASVPLAVTGTFWQTTQPVSGTFWQTTQPVSGTFWQATQPVSGTFWQATQPVSGTVTATQGTGTNLHMVCDSGCSSSAGFADNSTFTVGTTAINPIGGLYDTGADPTVTNGSAARARIDSHSYLLVDGSQVTQPVSGTFWQTTQPVSGTFWQATQPVSGTFWQATQPVSCAAGSSCPVNATLQAGSAIAGKFGIDQTTPGTTNAVQATNFPAAVDTNTGNASASTLREALATNNPAIANWGQGATNAAPPANGVLEMAVAATALPAAATVTDTVAPMADKFGRQVVIPFAMRDLVKPVPLQTTNATQTALLAAQGAGIFADLTSLTITTESATACTVAITDGTNNYKVNVGNAQGYGATVNVTTPIPATSSNTAWQVTGCASVTLDYVAEFVLNK